LDSIFLQIKKKKVIAMLGFSQAMLFQGIHGLGGRMGTRVIDPQPLIFDHAAQFFTVSDPRFSELVDDWLEKGLVRQWQGIIGELEVGGQFLPFPSSTPRYISVNGMRSLADSILSQVVDHFVAFSSIC
jgi:predicted NAD/FAD-dependent oxidoreductase